MNRAPIAPEDRDHARWLGRIQTRTILPVKYAILAIAVLFWLWPRGWLSPPPEVFLLFVIYLMLTAAETYFFAFDRITPRQVRAFATGSYMIDLCFVAALVHFDSLPSTRPIAASGGSDFYVLYLLMVVRGLVLFRTRAESLAVAVLITVLFAGSAVLQVQGFRLLDVPTLVTRLLLIWTTTFLSLIIIDLFNRQREEMLRTRERMVRSESLAALGELAAGVAHEVNNPIGIIGTYCEYLRRLPDVPYKEDIEQIQREAKRCEEIVKRMLDFSNPRLRPFEAVDVGALLSEVRDFVLLDKSAGIDVRLEVPSGIPRVHGDPAQLRQAVLNCVMNARQALQESDRKDGTIRLSAERQSGPRAPVRLRIRDNGPGIAADTVERAFEPFFTKRAAGTGLGLAITRRIVDAHDGRIAIGPLPEGGTEVTIELPQAGEER